MSAVVFNSYDSVNDFFKETALKSLDTIDFQSLLSLESNESAKKSLLRPVQPASRQASSDSTKEKFMEAMISMLNTEPTASETAKWANESHKRRRSSSSLSSIGTFANSRTWNNLGSNQEIQVSPVFELEREPTPNRPCQPKENDILLGRGGRSANHPGNKRYLATKDAMQPRYMSAPKSAKKRISQQLVSIVNDEWKGRFLKLDTATEQWYEIDNETARKKCSQALREVNTPEVRAAKRARFPKKKN